MVRVLIDPPAQIEPVGRTSVSRKEIEETRALIERHDGDAVEIGRRLIQQLSLIIGKTAKDQYMQENYGKSYRWASYKMNAASGGTSEADNRKKMRDKASPSLASSEAALALRDSARLDAKEGDDPRKLFTKRTLHKHMRNVVRYCPADMTDDEIRAALDQALKRRSDNELSVSRDDAAEDNT